jgi:hypothetical protein
LLITLPFRAILNSFVFIADASLSLRVIPELLNRRSHGFPKRRNKFCAFAQNFDRAREMSRERSRGQSGTIEIGPVEPRELGAPGSRDGFAREHSGSKRFRQGGFGIWSGADANRRAIFDHPHEYGGLILNAQQRVRAHSR